MSLRLRFILAIISTFGFALLSFGIIYYLSQSITLSLLCVVLLLVRKITIARYIHRRNLRRLTEPFVKETSLVSKSAFYDNNNDCLGQVTLFEQTLVGQVACNDEGLYLKLPQIDNKHAMFIRWDKIEFIDFVKHKNDKATAVIEVMGDEHYQLTIPWPKAFEEYVERETVSQ